MVSLGAKRSSTLVVAGVLTLVTSSQGIFTTASKVDGKYEYNFGTIVLLAELVSNERTKSRRRKRNARVAKITNRKSFFGGSRGF